MDRLSDFLGQLRCLFSRNHFGFRSRLAAAAGLSLAVLLSGCSTTEKKTAKDLQYLDGDKPVSYYKDHVTAIEYPCIDNVTARAVQLSGEPHSLQRDVDDEVRDISLHECLLTALSHNEIIETSALGGVGSKAVLTNPTGVVSVYDSAIQETNILFGRRGVEAALSDFDTTLGAGMNWGRDNQLTTSEETGAFTSFLSKAFASGASAQVYNNWNYLGTNMPAPGAFHSTYAGTIGASVRQPLLAGSGVEFTRVAGPSNLAFGSITGVSQGVLIARINQDITLADFESAVQNGLRDIESAYWDLYLNYQLYETAVTSHKAAIKTWNPLNAMEELGAGLSESQLQARDRVYETKASCELALNEVYKGEGELRRLMGLPMNDGTILRPSDAPAVAELQPDWKACMIDGLTHRVELRRQKWQIKSLQLQLDAARSLVRPRLDAVGSYDVDGVGDQLISQNDSAFGSVTHDSQNTWTMGVQFSMPLGLRQARSQARNYELQVARANAILAAQERSIAHDIAVSIQDVAANFSAAQSTRNRFEAAAERLKIIASVEGTGRPGERTPVYVDLLLRAQESRAQAEASYFRQIVAYNKAIMNLHLATGRLLAYNNVYLSEGRWCPEAYDDATLRAVERTHAKDKPSLDTVPSEFVSKGPAGAVELQTPEFQKSSDPALDTTVPEVPPAEEAAPR